jgi:hypothetical protein
LFRPEPALELEPEQELASVQASVPQQRAAAEA